MNYMWKPSKFKLEEYGELPFFEKKYRVKWIKTGKKFVHI